ncbi:Uncharacterised protein [Bordetella pertussis]|nr:Uncharacterised protein [Bordetella pertussis]
MRRSSAFSMPSATRVELSWRAVDTMERTSCRRRSSRLMPLKK